MKQLFILFPLAHKGRIIHIQAGCGRPHISILLVSTADVVIFKLRYCQPQIQAAATGLISLMAACNGQVSGQNVVSAAENDGLFHHVFQLPDIARPSVAVHYLHSGRGKNLLETVFLIHIGQERLNQGLYVPLALPQGWDLDGHHVEPIVEILTEGLFTDHLQQVPVGGGHDTHIHRNGTDATDTLDLSLLKDPQEVDLHVQGQVTDFIQEDGALVGAFKDPHFSRFVGPGKGPALVAEELAFNERGRDCSAVDADKALSGPGGVFVGQHRTENCVQKMSLRGKIKT